MNKSEALYYLNDLILDRKSFINNKKDISYNEVFMNDIEALEFAIDYIENCEDFIDDLKDRIITLMSENRKLKNK